MRPAFKTRQQATLSITSLSPLSAHLSFLRLKARTYVSRPRPLDLLGVSLCPLLLTGQGSLTVYTRPILRPYYGAPVAYLAATFATYGVLLLLRRASLASWGAWARVAAGAYPRPPFEAGGAALSPMPALTLLPEAGAPSLTASYRVFKLIGAAPIFIAAPLVPLSASRPTCGMLIMPDGAPLEPLAPLSLAASAAHTGLYLLRAAELAASIDLPAASRMGNTRRPLLATLKVASSEAALVVTRSLSQGPRRDVCCLPPQLTFNAVYRPLVSAAALAPVSWLDCLHVWRASAVRPLAL